MTDNTFAGFDLVNVNRVSIMSIASKKAVDISPIVTSIEVYGTIFSPVTTGTIKVNDSLNVAKSLPILGQELLELEFTTPNRKPFTRSFFVHGLKDKSYGDNGSMTGYTLVISSVEHYQASLRQVSRADHCLVSDFLTNILKTDLKTEKPLNIEPTKGLEKIVIPNLSAWAAIEDLRKRAVSNEYASPYLFFEDNNGYHFLTYEKLIEQRESMADELVYNNNSYRPGAGDDAGQNTVLPRQFREVMQFEVISRANSVEDVFTGGISNQQILFDPFTKTTKNIKNNYADLKDIVKKPLGDKFYPDKSKTFTKAGGEDAGPISICLVNSTEGYYQRQETEGVKTLFAAALNTFVIAFTAYGDSQLQPGDIIEFQGPALADSPEPDKQVNGKYIIGNLRHGINGNAMYTTIEAYRFGSSEKIIEDEEEVVPDTLDRIENLPQVEVMDLTAFETISPLDTTTLSSIELVKATSDESVTETNGLAGIVSRLKSSDMMSTVSNVRTSVAKITSHIRAMESRFSQISYGTSLPLDANAIKGMLSSGGGFNLGGSLTQFEQIKSQYDRIESISSSLKGASGSPLAALGNINSIFNNIPTNLPNGTDMTPYKQMLNPHIGDLQQYMGKVQTGVDQIDKAKRKLKGVFG